MTKVRIIPLAALLLALLALLVFGGCRSAHTTSAILYIEEQQYQLAVDVIHEGFAYQDDEPDAYYYLGEAYAKLAEVAIDDNDSLCKRRVDILIGLLRLYFRRFGYASSVDCECTDVDDIQRGIIFVFGWECPR